MALVLVPDGALENDDHARVSRLPQPDRGRETVTLFRPCLLGLVERPVRLADDLRGRVGGLGVELRDPDGDGDVQGRPAVRAGKREGLHPLAQPLRHDERALHVHRGQDHGELLPAVARGKVHLPDRLAEELGDFPDDAVSLQVAVGVVELLEVVDVEHHEAEGRLVAPRSLQLLVEGLLEEVVGEQAGHAVRGGLAEEARVLDGDGGEAHDARDVLDLLQAVGLARAAAGQEEDADGALVRAQRARSRRCRASARRSTNVLVGEVVAEVGEGDLAVLVLVEEGEQGLEGRKGDAELLLLQAPVGDDLRRRSRRSRRAARR